MVRWESIADPWIPRTKGYSHWINITLLSEKHDNSKFWSIGFQFDFYVYQHNKFDWIANWQQGHLVLDCHGYTKEVTAHDIDLNYPVSHCYMEYNENDATTMILKTKKWPETWLFRMLVRVNNKEIINSFCGGDPLVNCGFAAQGQ